MLTNEPALRLASLLCEHTFAERVFFANSGGEANEAAFKLARRFAWDNVGEEKHEIVSCLNSFHGRTLFTVTVGGQEKYTEGFRPAPEGIKHIPFNDIDALKQVITDKSCAFVVEPIQGEGGVMPATLEFLMAARERCDEVGALLVFDEIQTGMGRTGSLYAYQKYGVVPDILTTAKALGGGFPIAAMLTTENIAKSLAVGTHGSTYGGNPLGCAVAEKAFELVNQPYLLQSVKEKSVLFKTALSALNDTHGLFEDVRGEGLLVGAELKSQWHGKAKMFVNAALEAGLMILVAGPNVLRFAPALNIPEEDIFEGMSRLGNALGQVALSEDH